MSKSSKGITIFLLLIIIAIIALIACYCLVPQVKTFFDGIFISSQAKDDARKAQLRDDDHYKDLSDDEKKDFDEKLDQIINSDEYKDMTDDEKDELMDKFVESEKIQQEIQQEQEQQETRKEEIKQELGGMSEELNNILTSEEELSQSEQVAQVAEAIGNTKNELKDIINSGTASAEEIAEAQEKLEKVEALEQEYVANQTTSSITETITNNNHFQNTASNLTINKINGIYSDFGRVLIDAEFIQTETTAGVEICSKISGFCEVGNGNGFDLSGDYFSLIDSINNSEHCSLLFSYTNKNADWHKEYFDKNKYSMDPSIQTIESIGFNFSVLASWETDTNSEHPEYIIKREMNDDIRLYIVTYNNDFDQYSFLTVEKACPEFWAQVEAEQGKQAAESDVQAQSVRSSFATYDEKGEVTSFDFTAYREHMNKQKTPVEQDLATATNEIFPDFDFSL